MIGSRVGGARIGTCPSPGVPIEGKDGTMDPDATLRELREQLREWGTAAMADEHDVWTYEKFAALDEWLSRGNFLPDEWSKGR